MDTTPVPGTPDLLDPLPTPHHHSKPELPISTRRSVPPTASPLSKHQLHSSHCSAEKPGVTLTFHPPVPLSLCHLMHQQTPPAPPSKYNGNLSTSPCPAATHPSPPGQWHPPLPAPTPAHSAPSERQLGEDHPSPVSRPLEAPQLPLSKVLTLALEACMARPPCTCPALWPPGRPPLSSWPSRWSHLAACARAVPCPGSAGPLCHLRQVIRWHLLRRPPETTPVKNDNPFSHHTHTPFSASFSP